MKPTTEQLEAALNTISAYVTEHMPNDYELVLTFSELDVDAHIVDPCYDELDVHNPFGIGSLVERACQTAKDHEEEQASLDD